MRELLQRVKDDGKQIALASSAKEDEIEVYKRIAHIEDLVEEQASSDDAERSKPHPDIFEAALQRLRDVTAMEAVAIGDSPYDAMAAKKLGMTSIGVLSGGFPESDFGRPAIARSIEIAPTCWITMSNHSLPGRGRRDQVLLHRNYSGESLRL